MGVVYRAVHQTSGLQAAVKVLPATWGRAAEFLERLRREAAALRRLDHPNIIHIFEVDGWIAIMHADGLDAIAHSTPLVTIGGAHPASPT